MAFMPLLASADSSIPATGQCVPLTDAQIKEKWPNLPTAKQIYENEVCVSIDLRYFGKRVSSMDEIFPDPDSEAVFDVASQISNYTITTHDLRSGNLVTVSNIWLQYDSNIWVQVPYTYLNSEVSDTTKSANSVTRGSTTWGVGLYANPQTTAGTYGVQGVCTFGQFKSNTFGTGDEFISTVLNVGTTGFFYQLGMTVNATGRFLEYNAFSKSTGNCIAKGALPAPYSTNTTDLYNMYIRYNSGIWQIYWDHVYLWPIVGDTSSTIITGNQCNVLVESNCFTSSRFSGFTTNIGGTHSSGNKLSAVAYLFNGNWKPSATGDTVPAGYVYSGGTYLNGEKIADQAPPNNWGSNNIGITSNSRGTFTVGAGLTQRAHGYALWASGGL